MKKEEAQRLAFVLVIALTALLSHSTEFKTLALIAGSVVFLKILKEDRLR
ncbi:MAG: hypothetical protein JXR30_03945 [Alphaproteobacteria bacterium]|nr:hypothetical protein [Alphaproteobacteria bacterium]